MKKTLIFITALVGFIALIGSIFLSLTAPLRFQIVAVTTPQPMQLFEPIVLLLNKTPTPEFLKSCQFSSSPSHSFTQTTDGNSLIFTPNTTYAATTSYLLQLNCESLSWSDSFLTKSLDQLSPEEAGMLQTQKDFEFASELSRVYQDQPWREKLPIKTTSFVVVYEQRANEYLVELFTLPGSEPNREQIESEIRAELQKIAAPTLPIRFR